VSGDKVILSTSAQRPEYMRDFLTCLASPDAHRVAFSYQKAWFAEDLLSAGLAEREAIIVFCDAKTPHSEFDFLAVRHVLIEELVPPSTIGLRDDTAITVVFRLNSLTAVSDAELPALRASWNAALGGLDHRPRPKEHPEGNKALFVFEHPGLDEAARESDPKQAWRVLSEELGKCTTLENAFFFRVGELRPAGIGSDGDAMASEKVGSLRHVYSLRPSSEYELPMDAYSKSGKTPYSEAIAVTASSDQLAVQAITQSGAGRASEAVLVLRAGEVKRAQIATLIIHGAEDFEHLVPRVELATRIKPNLWLAALLMAVIAVGVVLGGLPKDALGVSEPVLYGLKALGGLIVGAATLLALGRVSGVGK
jgi:hypothetical protein